MFFRNPFKKLSKFERMLWVTSVVVVTSSFLLVGSTSVLTLIASLVGVTALIFVAKGDVWGQILTVSFSVLYAIISLKFKYFGEMITYLGMTAPIAILSIVSWLKNPYNNSTEVEVNSLTKIQKTALLILTPTITFIFYFILLFFNTNNLFFSTVSIATSFAASYLMLYRSPFYALAYAANDIVLITLWVLAAAKDASYVPMVICFTMFLLNDIYGYLSWLGMKKRQKTKIILAD
ncbi:MAG: nicotinamide riboside transporter PnuC [Lachnospirales bacterium]